MIQYWHTEQQPATGPLPGDHIRQHLLTPLSAGCITEMSEVFYAVTPLKLCAQWVIYNNITIWCKVVLLERWGHLERYKSAASLQNLDSPATAANWMNELVQWQSSVFLWLVILSGHFTPRDISTVMLLLSSKINHDDTEPTATLLYWSTATLRAHVSMLTGSHMPTQHCLAPPPLFTPSYFSALTC